MPILKNLNTSAVGQTEPAKEIPRDLILANEILKEVGREDLADNSLTKMLDEEGMGLRDCIKDLKILQKFADNEGVRHGAIRTTLEMHGVLGKKSEQSDRPININILGSESANLQLNSIFNPKR